MIFDLEETRAILRMIETEHLDIRTVTLGVSLRGCAAADMPATEKRVYDHISRCAERLVPVAKEVQDAYGVPIINKRISVTPIALVGEPTGASSYVPLAQAMDRAAGELGIDYIAGFSALVEKGITPGDAVLLDSIPEALAVTQRVCSSVNVATTRAGINMDAIAIMGHTIRALAHNTADRGGIGCAKLVTFANMPEDNPFVAGANHGIGEGGLVLNVGVSGPGVVLSALRRLRESGRRVNLTDIAETIKRMSFKITRAGELIGQEVARRLGNGVRFGIVDLSLAPTPAMGDSVAEILEVLGLERTGCHGTTAALALLTDAVKKGGAMATSCVGGLSGAFIPVSEDHDMIAAVEVGALSLDKLEAMRRRVLGRPRHGGGGRGIPRRRLCRRSSPMRSRSGPSTTRRPRCASSPPRARASATKSSLAGSLGRRRSWRCRSSARRRSLGWAGAFRRRSSLCATDGSRRGRNSCAGLRRFAKNLEPFRCPVVCFYRTPRAATRKAGFFLTRPSLGERLPALVGAVPCSRMSCRWLQRIRGRAAWTCDRAWGRICACC